MWSEIFLMSLPCVIKSKSVLALLLGGDNLNNVSLFHIIQNRGGGGGIGPRVNFPRLRTFTSFDIRTVD